MSTVAYVRWRGGRASASDVSWARSVSTLVAAAPMHVAVAHLQSCEGFALNIYSEADAARVRQEGTARGHEVELLTLADYDASYVASALGCSAMREEQLRVVFRPSFHLEGVATARRMSDGWEIEARVSRESLWYTRFTALGVEDWDRVARSAGVDVFTARLSRDEASDEERSLVRVAAVGAADEVGPLGADGINIHASSQLGGATFEQELWCPASGTKTRAAAELALRLLERCAPSEWLRNIRSDLG